MPDFDPEYGDLVTYQTKENVAKITLNAPKRANTYSFEMMRELDDAILEARFDQDVEAIMLTGAGDRFFCAGADISMLNEADPKFKYQFCLHANETLNRLEQTDMLVLAALNGHTVGGGLEIAMACDLRVAHDPTEGENEANIGLPEVNLGVLPGTGGTQRLARLIGKSRAMEWMTTGQLKSFQQAAEVGLVNEFLEADSVEAFEGKALEYASQFTSPDSASQAVGNIKRAVQSGPEVDFTSALAMERELQQRLFESEDADIGLEAYVNDERPEFTGE
ncbi:enoyl-CoA hydratase [Thermoplasmatales archaeon SW_10_69_26]|nr:MAG: enoyl-CoA hydratase [Thermoplasmatales archaeon SW_10_69_26]